MYVFFLTPAPPSSGPRPLLVRHHGRGTRAIAQHGESAIYITNVLRSIISIETKKNVSKRSNHSK